VLCLSIFYPNMLNFLLYYVMLHVDAGGNPARHCDLGPGWHLYAVFVLICLACFMTCIFLCCMLFYCFNIDVPVFIFGKKLCRAYVIMLYTCRIKIKFSYLINTRKSPKKSHKTNSFTEKPRIHR
jgi:hypothetical protein